MNFTASIMSGSSSMHGNSSSVVTSSGQPPGINGVKLEGQYYCNSYTPPTPVDHSLLPPSYSKLMNAILSLLFLTLSQMIYLFLLIDAISKYSRDKKGANP